MQNNNYKAFDQLVNYFKLKSFGLNKTAWLLLVFPLFTKGAFAFSVGAVNGLNCIGPSCSIQAFFLEDQFETVHQHITHNALSNTEVKFAPNGIVTTRFLSIQLKEIEDANMEVDRYQSSIHGRHFDNESLIDGQIFLEEEENILINSLTSARLLDRTYARRLRKHFGTYLHTLQDFFSHSSWVNSHSNAQDVPKFWKQTLSPALLVADPCPYLIEVGGVIVHDIDSLAVDKPLTTGYANGIAFDDAPVGKCAHGLIDRGIHKDWTGRDFHDEARAQAVYATAKFAKFIINYPGNNPDNVCMFMTDKPCNRSVIGPIYVNSINGTIFKNAINVYSGVSIQKATNIFCTRTYSTGGAIPNDPPVPTSANHDSCVTDMSSLNSDCISENGEYITCSSGPFNIMATPGELTITKLRFGGYNSSGRLISDVYTYSVDNRPDTP